MGTYLEPLEAVYVPYWDYDWMWYVAQRTIESKYGPLTLGSLKSLWSILQYDMACCRRTIGSKYGPLPWALICFFLVRVALILRWYIMGIQGFQIRGPIVR